MLNNPYYREYGTGLLFPADLPLSLLRTTRLFLIYNGYALNFCLSPKYQYLYRLFCSPIAKIKIYGT